jgi:predicted phosphodiesterase
VTSSAARLAIVSDVHGNLTALDAVAADVARRGVDRVVHGGDLALIGARPAEVVDRIAELGWEGIVGNTDELLWRPDDLAPRLEAMPQLAPLLRMLYETYAPVTAERLGPERLDRLRALPAELRVEPAALVHASPGDLWRAPAPDAGDPELARVYEPLGAGLAVYGHIHRPYVRRVGALTVANSGSVGLPFDDDPRASYLLVDGEDAEVVRVEYDVEAEVAALRRSGYPDAGRIAQMLRRGRFVAVGAA